jgi:CHAT domain-containing protein
LLTVRMLIERAEHLRCNLAILSACESGRVEAADLMNDALGLPGALLTAGCGGVIATFWPVRDLVASLVLDQTFETWRAGCVTLPVALARATRWLRDATTEKVCARLAAWREENPEFASLLETAMEGLRQRGRPRPFADEIEWAAFHVVGNPELPREL